MARKTRSADIKHVTPGELPAAWREPLTFSIPIMGNQVKVKYEPLAMTDTHHFEFFGEVISETGYHSDFIDYVTCDQDHRTPQEYAAVLVDELYRDWARECAKREGKAKRKRSQPTPSERGETFAVPTCGIANTDALDMTDEAFEAWADAVISAHPTNSAGYLTTVDKVNALRAQRETARHDRERAQRQPKPAPATLPPPSTSSSGEGVCPLCRHLHKTKGKGFARVSKCYDDQCDCTVAN